jgi:RsiW-degrading membrane proteinase PrsW (M82 family)
MTTVAISVIPCLIWLAFFYFQDRYDKEPVSTIAKTFGLGALMTLPALILNTVLGSIVYLLFGAVLGDQLGQSATFFLVVGPVEETLKFLAVYIYAYRRPEFDEPADGAVYSAASALGFAAVENVLYLARSSDWIILLRGPISNPGHAFFAACWGMAMSRAKSAPNLPGRRASILLAGLAAAAFLHGLFDTLLGLWPLIGGLAVAALVLALMLAMFVFVEYSIISAVRRSPRRAPTELLSPPTTCDSCGSVGLAGNTCANCGAIIKAPAFSGPAARLCLACRRYCVPTALFCHYCGIPLRPRLRTARGQAFRPPYFAKVDQSGTEEILFVLNRPEISIGKTLDNELVLDHPSVSKHHARVIWHPSGHYYIADLGSTNGTYVNGERIKLQWLFDGCLLRIGQVALIYRNPNKNVPRRWLGHTSVDESTK